LDDDDDELLMVGVLFLCCGVSERDRRHSGFTATHRRTRRYSNILDAMLLLVLLLLREERKKRWRQPRAAGGRWGPRGPRQKKSTEFNSFALVDWRFVDLTNLRAAWMWILRTKSQGGSEI